MDDHKVDDRKKLTTLLETARDKAYATGNRFWRIDTFLSVTAIITSAIAAVLAGILAGREDASQPVLAVLAGIPGVSTGLQKFFDYRIRSGWKYVKAARLNQLVLDLNFNGGDVGNISKEFGAIEATMEKEYSTLLAEAKGLPTAAEIKQPATPKT